MRTARRRWRIAAILVAVVAVVLFGTAFLIDEPLRRRMEGNLNANLKGYHATIGKCDFHPLGWSIDLEDVAIIQDDLPDPPVASIPELSASVHWRALIFGRLVADVVFRRPAVHVTLAQAEHEVDDPMPLKNRGWQDALQAIYPLKINELKVVDGALTYVDGGPYKPLKVTDIDFRATNIRNVKSGAGEYPSDMHLTADVLETARLKADGAADFLAKPHATMKTTVELTDLRLDYLQPAIHHFDLTARKGRLSARGEFEYATRTTTVALREVTVRDADLDYGHREEETTAKRAAREVAKTATTPEQAPETIVRVDRVRVVDSTLGLVNKSADPAYRIFLSDLDLTLRDFSNQKSEGRGTAELHSRFMGSGTTDIVAHFQPQAESSDFDLDVRIENVDLPAMNDLLRAHGGFDVVRGQFSFYSELAVRHGTIDGYVKPLFRDIDVYDPQQDKEKSLPRKVYERIVGGVAQVLENRPHEDVATKTDISGPVENPRSSTLQIIANLVRNAFFDSILPGLDKERARA